MDHAKQFGYISNYTLKIKKMKITLLPKLWKPALFFSFANNSWIHKYLHIKFGRNGCYKVFNFLKYFSDYGNSFFNEKITKNFLKIHIWKNENFDPCKERKLNGKWHLRSLKLVNYRQRFKREITTCIFRFLYPLA